MDHGGEYEIKLNLQYRLVMFSNLSLVSSN